MQITPLIDTFPKLEMTPARMARHHASTLEIARGIQRGWEGAGEVIQRKPMTTAGELIKMLSELQLRRSE